MQTTQRIVLLVDDDAQDRMLIRDAFKENNLDAMFHEIESGDKLLSYLSGIETSSSLDTASEPCLILLDLNMPKKDGRQILKELKTNPKYKAIPVVVLTTSKSIEDINSSYNNGANSFITKPMSFEGLIEMVDSLRTFWLETASLPVGLLN